MGAEQSALSSQQKALVKRASKTKKLQAANQSLTTIPLALCKVHSCFSSDRWCCPVIGAAEIAIDSRTRLYCCDTCGDAHQIERLQEVWLQENSIDQIPPATASWSSVELVYLNGNQLKEIPEHVEHWSAVEEVNFRYASMWEYSAIAQQHATMPSMARY
jgi:Leucine-rich repeat (LRR) protein